MSTRPFSLRIDDKLRRQLEREASKRRLAVRTLAQQLLDHGIRMIRHPLVILIDRGGWWDAVLTGFPRIRVMRIAQLAADGAPPEQIAEDFVIPVAYVDAALRYYRDHRAEIDRHIAEETAEAEEAERAFRERQASVRS